MRDSNTRLGRIAVKVVESYLTDDWQTTDEISVRCCGMSRSNVATALLILYREGTADRRHDPHRAQRIFQYRLASEVSE